MAKKNQDIFWIVIPVGIIVGGIFLYKYLKEKEKKDEEPPEPTPPNGEPPIPPTPTLYKYIGDYVKLHEFSARHDVTGEVFYNLYWDEINNVLFIRYPKWNGEIKEEIIDNESAKYLILNEKVAELFNIPEEKLNELGFTYTK